MRNLRYSGLAMTGRFGLYSPTFLIIMTRRRCIRLGGVSVTFDGFPHLDWIVLEWLPMWTQVKRVESANQLAMVVASDEEDDTVDVLLEQHHNMMRTTSAYSLVSNAEASSQPVSVDLSFVIWSRSRCSVGLVEYFGKRCA